MKDEHSPKRFLNDPLADRGNGIQELAKRHARLFLRANIWQRSPAWVTPLRDRKMLDWYAFSLYCRLVRRYELLSALPDDSQPLDPIWLEGKPIVNERIQETDSEALVRILYIAAFTDTLSFSHYLSNYIVEHVSRWNDRIHELAQTIPDEQQRRRSSQSAKTFTELVEATLFEFLINPVPLRRIIASEQPSWDVARAWRYFLCLEDRAMVGYWFGGAKAEEPSLLEVLSGLFLAYGEGRYDESDPLDVHYHNNLIHVLGQDLYNRFSKKVSHTYPYIVTSTADPDAQGGVLGSGGYVGISARTPWQAIEQRVRGFWEPLRQQSKQDQIAFIAPQEMTLVPVEPETMLIDPEAGGIPVNLVRGTEILLFDSVTGALHVCTAYGYFIDEHDEPGIIVIEDGQQVRYSGEQVADIRLPEEYPCS